MWGREKLKAKRKRETNFCQDSTMKLEDLMKTTLQVAPQTAPNSLFTLLLTILPQVHWVPEDIAKWGSPLLGTLEYAIHSSAFESLCLNHANRFSHKM